jgi:hypothetical protein
MGLEYESIHQQVSATVFRIVASKPGPTGEQFLRSMRKMVKVTSYFEGGAAQRDDAPMAGLVVGFRRIIRSDEKGWFDVADVCVAGGRVMMKNFLIRRTSKMNIVKKAYQCQ